MRPMQLILDTNLLFKGGAYLDRGQWPVLVSAARMGLVSLCIPEVVLREQVSHYRDDVAQAARDRIGSLRRLDRLRPPDQRDPDSREVRSSGNQAQSHADEWTTSYERWLRNFIDEHGRVLPLPTVGHDDLLDALFSARKPFAKSEKGYKDALIWWTVVEALDGEGWVFATDNTSDFLTADGSALAADLLADLRSRSKDPLHLGVRTTLDQLVAELIPRDTPAEDQFLAFARSSAGRERLAELIDGQRFPLQDPSGLMPAWPKWIEATGELEDPQFTRADARPVDGGSFLVSATVVAMSHVAGGLEEDQSADPGPGWVVWDDWGDGLTYAYGHMQRVTYKLTLSYSPPAEATNLDVESVSLNAPWLTEPAQ